MRAVSHSLIRSAILLGAIACFGMAMASMYEAGCAGDLKTGSYGDMADALRLETRAAGFAILAALVAGSLPRLGPIKRIVGAASVIVVSYIVFLFCGVYFETSGVQACIP